MKTCVDLCSGLGGFSQAFVEAGWKVVRVDVDDRFNPTVVADITAIDWVKFKNEYLDCSSPDVLLASPPCNHFSFACLQFPRIGVKKALEIVGSCFEAVAYLKPTKWLIENPVGRLRHIIGKPEQTIRYSDYDFQTKWMKRTDFWGNISLPLAKGERRIQRTSGLSHLQRLRLFPADEKLSAERAKIPLEISEAVLEAVGG
jgi:site-specific DNA-cytosine methylase